MKIGGFSRIKYFRNTLTDYKNHLYTPHLNLNGVLLIFGE